MLNSYAALALFGLVSLGLILIFLMLAEFIGPKIKTPVKMESYECGLPSLDTPYRSSSVHYYLVAVFFILFDIEVVFLYPWAVQFKSLAWMGLGQMLLFIGALFLGYLYILKKGLLEWK